MIAGVADLLNDDRAFERSEFEFGKRVLRELALECSPFDYLRAKAVRSRIVDACLKARLAKIRAAHPSAVRA